jgi:hypothetical protein
MAEITAALDEAGANKLLDAVIAAIGTQTKSGTGSLGPFTAGYTVSGTLTSGAVDLIPPDTIRIADLRLDWSVKLDFMIDLAAILPKLCLPKVCIDIPCVGRVCTPEICIPWPKIPVTVPLSDFVKTTVDTRLLITFAAGKWKVEAEVLGVPSLSFGLTTAALLVLVGAAITPFLLLVPFIGPFLALAVNLILATIGVAGLLGLLGAIITPFIAGLKFKLYEQPKLFEVLPAESPVDPKVDFNIDAIAAFVAHNGTEDELVLTADISP